MMNCPLCGNTESKDNLVIVDHSISKEIFHIASCPSCNMRFTIDAPTENKISPYYQSEDYISHSNTNRGLVFSIYHRVRKIMLGRKAKHIKDYHKSGRLLDVGCGTGYFAGYMQAEGYQVVGIEIDENARELGKSQFQIEAFGPEKLINKELGNPFKIITLWHVLEHLYGPKKYMEIFKDHLTEDGILVIAVPNYTSYDAKYFKTNWAAYDVPRHLWHFEPATMAILAEKTGFEIIDKKQMPFDPFYNSMLSAKYKKQFPSIIWGCVIGLVAYLQGFINTNRASSVIYTLKKKK
jgi:2-polyprenyl-3-methyl-5-hydroxy-6-metoxy-1,4-benzoquinol methylase